MSVDREYRIRISTVAEDAGFTKTQQAADETKAKILDGLNPALANMSEGHRESARAAEESEVSHKALKFGLHQLGQEAAETGHAMAIGLTNPVTAGFTLLTLLAGQFIAEYEKLREAAAEDVDFQGMERMSKTLGEEGMLKVLRQGSVAMADYFDKINSLSTAQKTLKQTTDEAVDALKKQAEADNKEFGEKEKAQSARIDALKKAGVITEEEANRRKAALSDSIKDQQGQFASLAQGDEIRKRREELGTITGRYNARFDKSVDAMAAQRSADAEVERLNTLRAGAEERQKKAEEMLSKHQTQILQNETYQRDLQSPIASVRASGAMLYNPNLKSMAQYEAEKMLALKQKVDIEEGSLPAAQEEAARRKRAAEKAQSQLEEDIARKKELESQLATMEADKKRDDATRNREHRTRSQTRAYESEYGGVAAGDLEFSQRVAKSIYDFNFMRSGADPDRSRAHRDQVNRDYAANATPENIGRLMDTASATAGQRVDLKTAIGMMQKSAADQDLFAQNVVKLADQMNRLATHHSTLLGRVASIEAQLANLQH